MSAVLVIVGAFKSVCDALSVRFSRLDYIDHLSFLSLWLHLQFSLSLFHLPTKRTNKTSLAMIDFAPCSSLLRPSVDWGFRFGLEVRKHFLSKRRRQGLRRCRMILS